MSELSCKESEWAAQAIYIDIDKRYVLLFSRVSIVYDSQHTATEYHLPTRADGKLILSVV